MPVTVTTAATAAAAAAAVAADRGARLLAGGTLLMRALNEGDVSITSVIRLADRTLSDARTSGSRVTIGASMTLAQIAGDRELAFLHPVVRTIAGPAVRTAATIGGNLFAPAPFGDLGVALLALDGRVTTAGGYGAREMSLEEFFAGRDRMSGAVVTSISCERPTQPDAFRWRKVSRVKPKGASVIAIAAFVPSSGARVVGPRIAYGAMAPTPLRARAAERALEGHSLDDAGIAAAVAAAAEGTTPATDAIASAWYRREVVGVHLRRLLLGLEA